MIAWATFFLLFGTGCAGRAPVVINKAVPVKAVDTTEIRKAIKATKDSVEKAKVHADAQEQAVKRLEADLPARGVEVLVETWDKIQADLAAVNAENAGLQTSLVDAQNGATAANEATSVQAERADAEHAQVIQLTGSLNESKAEIASNQAEKSELTGERNLYRKGFFILLGIGAVYLFLRLSPWTRLFVP